MIDLDGVTATVKETFAVLTLDDDGCIVDDDGFSSLDVDQFIGEHLDVWKRRDDGFYFVYSSRIEIGYWVNPKLININP